MLSVVPSARNLVPAAILALAGALALAGQTSGDPELAAAYSSLAAKDYDTAVSRFHDALRLQPGNAGAHKDLAYTLLKTGENAAARDEFEAALTLNRHDETAALEFAFLAYETGKPVEARRMFDRLRNQGSAATRATAEQAFQNIDHPLADGIQRWKQALAQTPNPDSLAMFSAHWELAHLAELRDELPLAAEQYEICRKLKPQLGEILIILARIWQQLNRVEDAKAAQLAASRSPNPRTGEQGLELWGTRYPYPYEFVNAIAIDPKNVPLRRELAFLYLAMNKQPEAIDVFQKALVIDPADHLCREQLDALLHPKKAVAGLAPTPAPTVTRASPPPIDPKQMGLKSLALGYARDAIRYLRQAHDDNPDDEEVMLRLGYAYNYAHDDGDALQWFARARHSSDPAIAAEATKAFRNLSGIPGAQTTVWALPMFSSRWRDVFSYGQIKRTIPLPGKLENRWVSFYLSTRLNGDLKSSIPQNPIDPLYLSDSAFVLGAGLATRTWHHLTGWVEAGESVKYLPFRNDVGAAVPDYRGGVYFAKGFGHLLGSSAPGTFFETTVNANYISRYDKDWILSSQNRTGWSFRPTAGTYAQVLFNINNTHDLKNQYWAETIEMGPGFKLHLPWMRPGLYFSTDLIRGVYTNNLGSPRRPNFDDIRVGFWYAFTK